MSDTSIHKWKTFLRRYTPLIVVLFLTIVLYDRFSYYNSLRSGGKVLVGNDAPLFVLSSMTGETVDLHSLKGEAVLLFFFSPTCETCIEEVPSWVRIQTQFSDKCLKFYGICNGTKRDVEEFLRKAHLNFTVLIDEKNMMRMYGVNAFPKIVLIDPSGRIALTDDDLPRDVSLREMKAKLQSILEKSQL